MKKEFIGDRKILSVTETDTETSFGSNIVLVAYETGEFEKMTGKLFDLIATEESRGYELVQKDKNNTIAMHVLSLFEEYSVKEQEIKSVFGACISTLETMISMATHKKFFDSTVPFIAGYDSVAELTIGDFRKIAEDDKN